MPLYETKALNTAVVK